MRLAFNANLLEPNFRADCTERRDTGLAVAMGSGQLDLAGMSPWGYIIANNSIGCKAVATVGTVSV
jgi:hypothetical protein